ncbi:MAG: DegT/DnrJ/EryC1/StrS family aminotransferase [Moheibacter sp.]
MPGFELFDREEQKHIQEVMDTGIIMRYNFDELRNNRWKAKELEAKISKSLQIKYVHLTSSGTTALITAMKALGIGAGDEVIMPVFTFVASFEAILFTGAIPVFADIDDSLTLNPESAEKAITPRTKAIMPVHMCGAMADLDALMKIAKNHKLYLIEDACQATGATYKGKSIGTIGDIGCLSFDFVKTVTCGEGGAVLTNDEKVYQLTEQFSDHGHDHVGNDRGAEDHPVVGLNFRISELHAAIGLGQWRKLDRFLAQQRKIKNRIKNSLKQYTEIDFRRIPDESGDNASFLSLILDDEITAKNLAKELKSKGIPCAYWYDNKWHYIRKWNHFKKLKNSNELYSEQRELLPDYENQDFSVSDAIMKKVVSIPISLRWDEKKADQVSAVIIEITKNQTVEK